MLLARVTLIFFLSFVALCAAFFVVAELWYGLNSNEGDGIPWWPVGIAAIAYLSSGAFIVFLSLAGIKKRSSVS